MLLPFRWLLYGTATAAAVIEKGTRKHPKIQRKLRRLARWSEAVAPPRISVVIQGSALPALSPMIVSGALTITRHVAVYSKGIVRAGLAVADFIGVDVSVGTEETNLALKSSLIPGEIETKIDLLEDEYLALMQLLAA